MSCFLFPKYVLKDIHSMVSNFWWGQRKEKKKLCWVSWSRFCKAKGDGGGLGFWDRHSFNLALLAKQGWRFIQNPSSIVKARYDPNLHFLQANRKKGASFAWNSLMDAKHLLQRGCQWRIGDGKSVRLWKDRWTKDIFHPRILFVSSNQYIPVSSDLNVSSLIGTRTGSWNRDIYQEVNFSTQEQQQIISTSICPQDLAINKMDTISAEQ